MRTQDKPLVTFALFAYNQDQYIREALAGALAQTYTPLQIILSDDCSSDNTFKIMQEVASQYDGPHHIVLNRNQKNQGIGAHINKLMSLTKGEFFIIAAGDDISEPDRTAVIVDKWMGMGRGALSVHTAVQQIDEVGRELGIRKPALKMDGFMPGGIIGASHGWSRRLFEIFGELNYDLIIEDQAIGFRALLSDGTYFIDRPLVKYRVGGFSASSPTKKDDCKNKRWSRWITLSQQHLADVDKLPNTPQLLKRKMEVRVRDYQLLQELACSPQPLFTLWSTRQFVTPFLLKRSLNYLFPRLFRAIQAVRSYYI